MKRGRADAWSLPALVLATLGFLGLGRDARAQEIVKRIGRVTLRVDTASAVPGGVIVVRLASTGRLGSVWALLDGWRAPFYSDPGPPRAIVPVALDTEPGPATLGVAIAARRGEQRIAIPIRIWPRPCPSRAVSLPEPVAALLARPELARDGRRLLGHVRTESRRAAPTALRPPVAVAGSGFGELRSYAGFTDVESLSDALSGERHRGIDYAVPVGTAVSAPASGTVLFAGPLTLSGETVVLDHGQGMVSVLQHLSRTEVQAGQDVTAGATLGASGASGLVPGPLLEWRVYLHGVAVDPLVLASQLE